MRRTVAVLLLAAVGCGKPAPPPPPPAPAPAPAAISDLEAKQEKLERKRAELQEKLVKAGLAEAPYVPAGPHVPPPPDPAEPVVGLSANGSDVAELPPGWPLVLRFRAHPSPRGDGALPADWAGRVRLEAGALPLKPAGELVWTATAAEVDALPRGVVIVTAVFDLPGRPLRASARVALVPPPKRADANAELRRVGAEVELAIVRGEPAAALPTVEALIKKRSQEIYLHGLRGECLEAAGRKPEAVAAYTRAAELAIQRKQSAAVWIRHVERLSAPK